MAEKRQNPDAQVLGELFAAPTTFIKFAHPSPERMAECIASSVLCLPGVSSSRVCLARTCAQAGGFAADNCHTCPIFKVPSGELALGASSVCALAEEPGFHVARLATPRGLYGFLVCRLSESSALAPYLPFLENFCSLIGLTLETELPPLPREVAQGNEPRASLSPLAEALRKETYQRESVENELRRLNRTLLLLSQCNQALFRAANEADLLNEVCRIAVEGAGYLMVFVGIAQHDEAKTVLPVAWAGLDAGYLASAQLTWADEERGRGPTGTCIRSGMPCLVGNLSKDPAFAPWREEALARGYNSSVALPLTSDGRTFGMLGMYAADLDAFYATEVAILNELAEDLAFGIATLRVRAAQARAQADLKLFRQLMNQTNDIIVVLDPDQGRILDVNGTACRALGYTREEFLTLCLEDVAPEWNAIRWRDGRQVCSLSSETLCRRKDGTLFSVESSVRLTVLNRKAYLIAVVRDITERKWAELALRASEEHFRVLFEDSPCPIFAADVTAVKSLLGTLKETCGGDLEAHLRQHPELGHECARLVRICDANRAALAMYAPRSKEEVLEGLIPKFAVESFEAWLRVLVGMGQGQSEMVLDGVEGTQSGRRRIVTAFISFVPGDVSRVLLSLVDVTALKQSERRLKEAHARLRLLLQTIPDMVWLKDPDGAYLFCNPPFERLVGRTEEQLIGQTDFSVAPPELADFFRTKDQEAIARRRPFMYEEWFTLEALAPHVLLETIKTPMYDAAGELIGVLGVSRDITALRGVEERLRKLERAVEQCPASIVITNLEGLIEYVNPKFSEMTGYTQAEALGQNPRMLKSGQTPPEHYQQLWQALRSGKEWCGVFHTRRKNGELFWELASISPVLDSAGAITHYVAVKEDITERKRLEEEFRQAQKMEAFGQLAGGVAHDINNVLTVIHAGAAMLGVDGLAAEARANALEQILDAAERASRLTRQLLTFSRRRVVQLAHLDLNDVVLHMTGLLGRLIGEHIRLVASYTPGAAPVHADAGMMEQVLMNLALNSRDAMPHGGELRIETEVLSLNEVTARQIPRARAGEFVCLKVNDTGSGIAQEHLSHIFEPFFTTKDIGKGTGLGLATVFGIVEQHHGWITVESHVGGGTLFRVYLPVSEHAPAEEERSAMQGERGGTETILLVEDETLLRQMVRKVLEHHGYRVYEAESASAALHVWAQLSGEIDLLLTDVVMPGGMGGWELGQLLQTERSDLKVIYSSGYMEEMGGGPGGGSFSLLEKPYEPVKLLRKIRESLDVL